MCLRALREAAYKPCIGESAGTVREPDYVYNVHVCTLVLQNRAEILKLNRGILAFVSRKTVFITWDTN